MEFKRKSIITAVSYSTNSQQVAFDLRDQLMGYKVGFVLFFCSAEYNLPCLAAALEQQLSSVTVVGCTTAGEITPDGYARGSITAIGFESDDFSVAAALIDNMAEFNLYHAQELVEQLIDCCRKTAIVPIENNSFALTLLDGLSSKEEVVLSTLNSALAGIPHFGGSAGDDNHLSNTYVYYDGHFYSGAAVVVLINTPLEFSVFSQHHLKPLEKKLVVTQVNSQNRQVYELNAEPAAQAYADLIDVKLAHLNMSTFARHPLAVKMGDVYYPRSIQKVDDCNNLTFYCAIDNGIVLTAMERISLVKTLDDLFVNLNMTLGSILITIGCDCVLRRLESELDISQKEIQEIFKKQNVVGFNTYGEQINGMHVNQTFTGVAIGNKYKK